MDIERGASGFSSYLLVLSLRFSSYLYYLVLSLRFSSCFNFGEVYCGKTERPWSWYQDVVAYRGICSSWKLPAVPPYRSRQILANIEKIEKILKNISQYLNNQKASSFINVPSALHHQTSGVSFFSQHLALSTLSCLLLSHSYSFFIAGQYYLTRFRLNLNIPFTQKTPTPSILKNCKHKQCSFHVWWHIKMYPKGKSSRKKRNMKL